MRTLTVVLVVLLTSGCGLSTTDTHGTTAATGLTDAEVVWCEGHAKEVYSGAKALLPDDLAERLREELGEPLPDLTGGVYYDYRHAVRWLRDGHRAEYERACRATFEARDS